jgi:hypothetical protein
MMHWSKTTGTEKNNLMSNTIAQPAPATWENIERRNKVAFNGATARKPWKRWETAAFRFFFIFFIIQAVPLDWKFYRELFSIDFTSLYYGDIFNLARYYPRFFSGSDTYLNWGVAALIALTGAGIWHYAARSKTEYNELYYWLRVILRYRLAIAVIAYGFIKIFPIQAPFPSISNLNTHYGDFTTWKAFAVSLGAAPLYEKFLGVVEIIAGLLLFGRRTATLGAFLIIAFAGNVFLSNLAYEGGEHIYSLYLVVIAVFLIVFDARRIWSLISQNKPTAPNAFHPDFSQSWKRAGRIVIKSAFIFFFVVLYGFKTYAGYRENPHTVPVTEGLSRAAGIYNVKEFVLNNDTLAYSQTDPVRWKDVVFEKWATISIRSNRPVITDTVSTEIIARKDEDKLYESAGSTGRHYFHYNYDSEKQLIFLENKNTHYKGETLFFHVSRPDSNTILLSGMNESNDSLKVTLQRLDKKYLFPMGRSKPIKL